LDYYITNTYSQGDLNMEANSVARLWWQIMGPFRFIEVPIWILVIFSSACLINLKNKFFPLLWLNFLAFQHLLGFFTWLPYKFINFLYAFPNLDSVYVIVLTSIFLSLLLSFMQTKPMLYKKNAQ